MLKLKVVVLMKTIIINVCIVFYKIVIALLDFFNFNLFLGLGYNFIGFFDYYNILVTRNTFFLII